MKRMRGMLVVLLLVCGAEAAAEAASATGAAAFERGCGGGRHGSEQRVLRAIPRGDEAERRAWIADLLGRHPCPEDALKAAILDDLRERTRR